MELYKTGKSAYNLYKGIVSSKSEHCCVVDFPQEKNAEEAYDEMIEYLVGQSIEIVNKNINNLSVKDKNDNTYILAHEETVISGEIYKKPASLIRYLLTRDFSFQSLCYINGSILEINKNGINDLECGKLSCTNYKDFETKIHKDPELLYRVLQVFIENEDYVFSDQIKSLFEDLELETLPKNINNFAQLFNERQDRLMSFIKKYYGLNHYFFNICGLKYKIEFNPDPAINNKKAIRNDKRIQPIDFGDIGQIRKRVVINPRG